MAIFPKAVVDSVVQVSDKFRIDATMSYTSKNEAAVTLVEIEPHTGDGFIAVTGSPVKSSEWYLDWQYSTSGTKTVSVRITTSGAPVTATFTVECVTSAVDKLFSNDEDLSAIESSISKYLPKGRSSFNYVHRQAQKDILEWLYVNGYTKSDNVKFDKDDVIDVEEVRYWSKYTALKLIFKDLSVTGGDTFLKKAQVFENEAVKWSQKAVFKIDVDGDGVQGNSEGFELTTRSFSRE